MAAWSPPSPPRGWIAVVALAFAGFFGYMVLIQGSILLGLVPFVVLAVCYVLWRFLVALEAIADGVHRIADQRERE